MRATDTGVDLVTDRARGSTGEVPRVESRRKEDLHAREDEGGRVLTCLRSWATSVTSSSTPGRSGDWARALTAASTAWSACMATSSSPAGTVGLPRLLPLRERPVTAPLIHERGGRV